MEFKMQQREYKREAKPPYLQFLVAKPSNSWKLLESIDKEAKLVAKMSGKPPTQADKARIQSTQAGKDDGGFASRIQSSADKATYRANQGNQSK